MGAIYSEVEITPQMVRAAKEALYESSRWRPTRGAIDDNFVRDLLAAGLRARMSPSSRSIPASEELGNLYQAIGFAMAQLQFVDAQLGRLFVELTKSANSAAANSSLFAVHSFYSKMDMVNAAAQQALAQQTTLMSEWDALYKTLDGNRQTRNNLAHFSAIVRGDLESTKHVYFLQPTWFDLSNYFDKESKRYHFEDVKQFGFQFDVTSREIEKFTLKVCAAFAAI